MQKNIKGTNMSEPWSPGKNFLPAARFQIVKAYESASGRATPGEPLNRKADDQVPRSRAVTLHA
jgi:hypothetical protein